MLNSKRSDYDKLAGNKKRKSLRDQPGWIKWLIGVAGFIIGSFCLAIFMASRADSPELPLFLFLLFIIIFPLIFFNLAAKKSTKSAWPARTCLVCNKTNPMKTWLGGYSGPQFIALVLLCVYLIPGLIFIAWGWGKYKCPVCGALGKSIPAEVK